MEVVFTFDIKDYQKEELKTKFPELTIHFKKKDAEIEVGNADVLVTYGGDVDASLLNQAESLKWIMVASAGVEKMPLAEIAERNIVLTNVRGIHKTPMAESVLAHILALRRSLPLIYERKETKEWGRGIRSSELKDSTALILGPGAIGSEIGRLLQAFGVRTIGCNRSGRKAASMDETIIFNELMHKLPKADYVISVLPSTPETKKLLTAEHFAAMKETAVFMNFGRGDLVDENVLIDVLKNNVIEHAVLDVFEVEPLPVASEFWTLENCTISPHISGLSSKYVERALVIFDENMEKWLKDDPDLVNKIDLNTGY
ncbi:D-2-hydroxyacid dehydrogenase [Sporosarcina sp. G11-34]|uniref:D-2-hydroxyacid dehydrogenase n=1 Tax=Sporosarcina sp. G11-34 TaxID=2849605 RepID=UPI0022A9CE01|nr:D-2-hydroxyacid dehydrogenase [Sporosarcina sp. G11-34]MCZ2260257.1 D-2-hydroxyacid dehydrogenase [Sporosarcina sp. G11-34]